MTTATALWWAVVASGIYHGLNPGMGWPLAVSAALMDRARGSLFRAMLALAGGHLVAMVAILFPFTALLFLAEWQVEIQTAAACVVIGLGLYLLISRRHPRFLARVPPSRLALWSFLVAMAHGAGLMLVPIYLGICRTVETDAGHAAAADLMAGNAGIAVVVALAHTLAMTVSGGALAFGVYRWLGLRFLSRGWFNLDILWALSLILVGVLSLVLVH
jgi:ABC-type tungstate transport system substrate-binding protein